MINITTDQKARRPEKNAMLRHSYATAERAWDSLWADSLFFLIFCATTKASATRG